MTFQEFIATNFLGRHLLCGHPVWPKVDRRRPPKSPPSERQSTPSTRLLKRSGRVRSAVNRCSLLSIRSTRQTSGAP
jgi:hypothetical protein